MCAHRWHTRATSDDAFIVTNEGDWFHAMDHAVELKSYCKSWHGAPVLSCLDVFSRSAKTATTFSKKGFRAHAYDLATRGGDDILSRAGFFEVLDLAMMLLRKKMHGFLFCMVLPDCRPQGGAGRPFISIVFLITFP